LSNNPQRIGRPYQGNLRGVAVARATAVLRLRSIQDKIRPNTAAGRAATGDAGAEKRESTEGLKSYDGNFAVN
jgi:hypothetical protein